MYCDYRDQASQSAYDIVASLMRQLAEYTTNLPDQVTDLYEKFGNQGRSTQLRDLEEAFLSTSADFRQVFVIIDALDECNDGNNRRTLLKFLAALQHHSSIRLLVTSRPHLQDMRSVLGTACQICIEAKDADLRAYLTEELKASGAHDIIDEEFRTEIVNKIIDRSQKM